MTTATTSRTQGKKVQRVILVGLLGASLAIALGCSQPAKDIPTPVDTAAPPVAASNSPEPPASPAMPAADNTSRNANTAAELKPAASANSNSAAQPAASPAAAKAMPDLATLMAREPARYSETTTVDLGSAGGGLPGLEFDYARQGTNRRASFLMPNIGRVIYLDRAGKKYIVFVDKKEYVEVAGDVAGVRLPDLNRLTPQLAIDLLKSRSTFESLGTESVDGRQAVKFHFKANQQTPGQTGLVLSDATVLIDEKTGLPLTSEIDVAGANGASSHLRLQTRNIKLDPDPASFEVGKDLKSVTPEEAKDRLRAVSNGLRLITSFANRGSK